MPVAEAARNLACVGADPRALVNCLNFGNPEHEEVMWQFSETTEGMSEACEVLYIPVVGGNVSFYNESRGRDIDPTPVVGLVGVIDELDAVPPPPALHAGSRVVVLGTTSAELGGSEFATVHGLRDGTPPAVDLDEAARLHGLVRALVREGAVDGVHDCSDGGLAIALAEMAIAGECGAQVSLRTDLLPALAWFSESASRVVLSVTPERVDEVLARATGAGVPAVDIGERRRRPLDIGRFRRCARRRNRRMAQRNPSRAIGDTGAVMDPGIGHACGVFGVYTPGQAVAQITYHGLYALQHRGQESAGIAVSDGQTITVVKDMGLVTQVFDERNLAPLDGHLAIGHVPILHDRLEHLAQRATRLPRDR